MAVFGEFMSNLWSFLSHFWVIYGKKSTPKSKKRTPKSKLWTKIMGKSNMRGTAKTTGGA